MRELISLNNSLDTLTVTSKTGATKTRTLRAKEWKEANADSLEGKSNKAIKKAYEAYLAETRKGFVESLDWAQLALLAEQKRIGLDSVGVNKAGNKLTLIITEADIPTAEQASHLIDQLPEKEKEALLEKYADFLKKHAKPTPDEQVNAISDALKPAE